MLMVNDVGVDTRVEPSSAHGEWSRRLVDLNRDELAQHAQYVEKSASELGVWERGGYIPLQPFLVSTAARRHLQRVHSGLKQLQVGYASDVAQGDARRLADAVGWSPAESWFLGAKRPLADALGASRSDVFVAGGRPRFLEINIGTCLNGNISSSVLGEVFPSTPVGSQIGQDHPVEGSSYLAELIRWVRRDRSGGPVNVALLGFRDDASEASLRWADEQAERFAAVGIWCQFVPVDEAEIVDDTLCWRNKRYDAAIRYFMASARVAEHRDFFHALEHATRTTLYGSYVSQLFASKTLLADLYQNDRNTAKQRRLLSYLPWTARLVERYARKEGMRIDPIAWAAGHRSTAVLKPGNQFGSRGVVVGALTSDAEWREALADGVRAGDHVVQELVEPDTWSCMYWHIESESLVRVESPVLLGQFDVNGADGGCHVQQPIKGSEVDLLTRDRDVSLGCVMSA
ncbi:hypothetical protein [Actinokineospora inagensis]|uniref:hypothetical protein n=1 Tax=Actinokineospora inagensis TaxID=103730 RepID=UPI000418E7F9|nr:hypothetical protein [Actinokineospora inagensis]